MTGVVVDSRLRQRRIDVDRAEGRRRLRRAGWVGSAIAVVLVAIGIVFSPLLDVDRIEVSGASRTSIGAVIDAGALSLGEPLVRLDTGRVAAGVGELPWIEDVSVTRSWWGLVSISVVERVPVGVVERDGQFVLVDGVGHVLAVSADRPTEIPQILMSLGDLQPGEVAPPDMLPLLVIAGRIPDTMGLGPGVFQLDGGDVVWEIEGVGRFRFGTASDLDEKLIALGTVLEALGGTVSGELDLRVPATVIHHVDEAISPTIDRDGLDIP